MTGLASTFAPLGHQLSMNFIASIRSSCREAVSRLRTFEDPSKSLIKTRKPQATLLTFLFQQQTNTRDKKNQKKPPKKRGFCAWREDWAGKFWSGLSSHRAPSTATWESLESQTWSDSWQLPKHSYTCSK